MASLKVFTLDAPARKFDTAESIKELLAPLESSEDVEEAHFSGTSLGMEACEYVATVLRDKKTLKHVNLSDIFTGRLISEIPTSLRHLCTSMLTLPALTTIDLSDNAFGGRSVEPMLEFLSSHETLEVLKLNNNGLGPAGGSEVARALRKNALKAVEAGRQPPLKVLVCGRNRLENGSALDWAAAFEASSQLTELRMPQNGIRMEGIEAIATALRSCASLQVLDLQDNTATEKGSRAIASSLASWPDLRQLNLSDCLLRPRGATSVMLELGKGANAKLESLKLQSNEMDARSVDLLADAILAHLSALTDLELNGNRGTAEDECYEKVREALSKWEHLEALDELEDMEEEWDSEDEEEEEEEEEAEAQAEAPTKTAETAKEDTDLSEQLGKLSV